MRAKIFVDGSNFYFKLKDLKIGKTLDLDFGKLGKFLARKHTLVEARYYGGRNRQDGSEKTELLFDGQQKLLGNLKKSGWKYTFGYLMKNDGVYHEKGVDVQIATDILVATYENICDRIIVVSSDTDLEPAIKKAKEKGKIIEYVGFSHKPSVAMITFCNESTLLKREDLEPLWT
mgnify:FL=1